MRSRFPRRWRRSQAGLTLVELVIASFILIVAVSIFQCMVAAAAGQRAIQREYAIANNAARVAVERMRNAEFDDVFALYNEWPGDDAAGAPGHRFAVPGLKPLPTVADGMCGTIRMPSLLVQDGEVTRCELRENVSDPALDLPRDLSGDSIIDSADHAGSYLLLPVHVRIEWQSKKGARHVDLYTMLTEMRK